MHSIMFSPFSIPLGVFAMVAIIVSVNAWAKTRQREIQMEHDLRLQQMEHERKMKELELEKLKLGKAE
jgi:sensor domain CHASE-containing protein